MTVHSTSPTDAVRPGSPSNRNQYLTATGRRRRPPPGGRSPRRVGVRSLAVVAVLTLLAATTAACGSGATSTTSSPSASPTSAAAPSAAATSGSTSYPAGKEQICQARNDLRTSITALTDKELLTSGTTAIKASVEQVQSDLDAVKAAGKDDYQTQVTALQSALQQLQAAVNNLGDGNATENMQAVGTAIASTGVAAEDLFTQLKTACGS